MTELASFLTDEFSFLSEIPRQGVINAFDGAFSDFDAFLLTHNFNFFDGNQSVQKLSELASRLHNEVYISDSGDFLSLIKNEASNGSNLCILFWYGIEYALKNGKTLGILQDGLYCARCYLLLASIKGAPAYDLYQPNIVGKCFDLYLKVIRIIKGKNCLTTKKKSTKSKKNLFLESDQSEELVILPQGEIKELGKCLRISLDGLFTFIRIIAIAKPIENIYLICRVIKNLLAIDISLDTCVNICNNITDFQKLSNFSDIAFSLLHCLCDSRHSALEILYPVVVMPRIMYAGMNDDQFIPKFVKQRLMNDEIEHETIYCMAVSACLKCPERNEYRTKILKSVVNIINNMSLTYKKRFSEDILKIGENTRGGLRAFAIDAIPYIHDNFKIINFNSQIDIDDGIIIDETIHIKQELDSQTIEYNNEELFTKNEQLSLDFIRLIIYGIDDKIGSVRQRALNILQLFINNGKFRVQCNKEIDNLYNELRELELIKYRREKKKRQAEAVAAKVRRIQSSLENNEESNDIDEDDNKEDGEDSDQEFRPPQTQDCDVLDYDKTQIIDAENIPPGDMDTTIKSIKTTTIKKEIKPDEVDLDSTDINIHIISDETGIFEKKRIFKIFDYPLLNRLLVRCDDSVSGCRRSAILALQHLFPYLTDEKHVSATINQFCRSARDKALSIRKQVADSVFNILCDLSEDHMFYRNIVNASMECIILQVVDREASVQQNAAKLIVQMVFVPLSNGETEDKIAWNILSICERVLTYQRILKQAVSFLVKEKLIDKEFVRSLDKLMKKLKDETLRQYIWMLYSILSIFFHVNPKDAAEEFLKIKKRSIRNESKICNYFATIISRGVNDLTIETRTALIQQIEKYIVSFKVSNNNISSLYYCYGVLLNGVSNGDEKGKILFAQRNKEIFDLAQNNMKLLMFEEYHGEGPEPESSTHVSSRNKQENDKEDVKLAKILGVIGEIVDYEQSLICKDLFEILQLIMSSEMCKKALKISERNIGRGTALSTNFYQGTNRPQSTTTGTECGRGTPLSIMKEFKTHHIKYSNITSIVQAQCIVIMGKICLVDEMFARDVIPVFMKELVTCKDYIIRNNIIVVTHDLCKQHTSLVGSYMDIFAACLGDDSVAVRVHALHCLTRLLKEGYLVWKGDIMFRFVSTLLDQVSRVRDYAEFCLIDTLLPVTPDMFFSNFIDCLFYFNGVEHPSWVYYNQAKGNNEGGKVNKHRSLQGTCYQNQRLQLYCFMLKNMTHVQKVAVTQKICIEVFDGVSLGSLDFNDINVQNMVVDCFRFLSSEDGKIRFNIGKDSSEEDGDDGNELRREAIVATAAQASREALREVFVKEVMKYLLQLRDFLYTSKNSRCAYEFLKYLLHLSNEHNYAFEKILDEEKHMSAGVRYDLIRMQHKLAEEI
ncbi:Condensin-2 complex subunit D3 [Strongyloides ratti]|uniref:Condensin-2 complex subunit D3 n=1 Tax=Strongyloides ratti TaxID=34506 RepID=A0A090L670_STRRB|nr:Condensin-2 complex subunit D3 [Strongyloides ratti]CEF65296.1 Condensin-2 complex subunit D3 [Strongyloides ratti]